MPTLILTNKYDPAAPATVYCLKDLLEALPTPVIGRLQKLRLMMNPGSPAGSIWLDADGRKPSGATLPTDAAVKQVETATILGTIPTATKQKETATLTETVPGTLTAGNVAVTITAAGMTNSPKTIQVAVATNDSQNTVAGKIRTALGLDADVIAFFTVSGATNAIILEALAAAANDATMNIAIADGTSVGIVAAPTAANTTAGVASGAGNAKITVTSTDMLNSPKVIRFAVADGDDASAIAGKARTALAADPNVAAKFAVSGATDKIILTRLLAKANDSTLNMASANDTCTGITPGATSANTTAGDAGGSYGVDLSAVTGWEQGGDYPGNTVLPENIWLTGQDNGMVFDAEFTQI